MFRRSTCTFSNTHGSGKWPIWRLNSISRAPCSPWTIVMGTKSRSSWSWYPSINVIQIVHMKVSYSFLFPTPVDMRGLCAGSFAYIPSNYNIIHLYIQHAYKIYIYISKTHTQKQIINIWPTKITLVAENNVMCPLSPLRCFPSQQSRLTK